MASKQTTEDSSAETLAKALAEALAEVDQARNNLRSARMELDEAAFNMNDAEDEFAGATQTFTDAKAKAVANIKLLIALAQEKVDLENSIANHKRCIETATKELGLLWRDVKECDTYMQVLELDQADDVEIWINDIPKAYREMFAAQVKLVAVREKKAKVEQDQGALEREKGDAEKQFKLAGKTLEEAKEIVSNIECSIRAAEIALAQAEYKVASYKRSIEQNKALSGVKPASVAMFDSLQQATENRDYTLCMAIISDIHTAFNLPFGHSGRLEPTTVSCTEKFFNAISGAILICLRNWKEGRTMEMVSIIIDVYSMLPRSEFWKVRADLIVAEIQKVFTA